MSDTKNAPRWGPDYPPWRKTFSCHMTKFPEKYRFLGQIDNHDIWFDTTELDVVKRNEAIMVVGPDDWTRYRLLPGQPPVCLYDQELPFDQLCQLCMLLEQLDLFGPDSSHVAWDEGMLISKTRKPENQGDLQ